MEAPLCTCHGVPQYWSKDARYTHGGFWSCREKQLERSRRRYEVVALAKNMRRQLTYHRKRLAILEERLSNG